MAIYMRFLSLLLCAGFIAGDPAVPVTDSCSGDVPPKVAPSREHLLLQKPLSKQALQQTALQSSLPTLLPLANKSEPSVSIKVMSYNLMGWSSFNVNTWKGENVLGKIRAWSPDILGAQEVEMGGWGYEDVEKLVREATGLSHAGGSQFFKGDLFQQVETGWVPLVGGYWMSMALFKHIPSGHKILFYDSHWKHGYGMEQAEKIAKQIQADRAKYGSPPTILVGDTNQFCKGNELEAIRYLKGLEGSCPVDFADVHEEDPARSFSDNNNPDCRVDFMLATRGQWSVVQASIDRVGMGSWGSASDHAPLMAHLVPMFGTTLEA